MNSPSKAEPKVEIQDQSSPATSGRLRQGISPAVGCALSVLLGLVGVFLVFQIGRLAVEGEVRFGGTELTPNRIWLVRDGGNRGLGWSLSRVVEGSRTAPEMCVATKVSFLLWRDDGTAVPVDFCECYRRSEAGWQLLGNCGEGGDS